MSDETTKVADAISALESRIQERVVDCAVYHEESDRRIGGPALESIPEFARLTDEMALMQAVVDGWYDQAARATALASQVARLETEKGVLIEELIEQWLSNHGEHCTWFDFCDPATCNWPWPQVLTDMGRLRPPPERP